MHSRCCLQGLHSASVPGILALDLCPSDTSKVLTGTLVSSSAVLHLWPSNLFSDIFFDRLSFLEMYFFTSTVLCSSGGADKNVVVFDKNEEQIVATLKGHTKKVTSVIYHPSQVMIYVSSIERTSVLHRKKIQLVSSSYSVFFFLFFYLYPSSRWSSLHLLTAPSVCGPSPGATVSRWCVPTRQVSLDCPCMPLGTTCSALLRIRCVSTTWKTMLTALCNARL